MKRKMLCALLAGLLLCGGLLGGCAGDTGEESSLTYVEEEQAENDGSPAQLVLGTAEADADRAAVLEEIAEKYTADFPNTQVEVRSYGSKEALQAALASGEADIGEMEEADVPQAVEEGLLLDLYDWVDTWEERYSLSQEAWQAIRTMGKDHAYVIPYDFDQLVTYYRADWFEEYNATAESAITPREWCRNWNQIARTVERLGEKDKVAFGGKERLGQLFDAALWGDLSLGRLGAQGAAYFAAGDEHLTIFTWEMLPEAVENFKEHYLSYTLPQSLEWTEEQAVEAFLNGEAAILFAGSGVGEELAASLPEGSWGTIGPVQGATGASIISDQYVGWAASARSEEPEIAAHVLLYLSSADNNTHFAKVTGALPIHVSALEMEPSLLEGDRGGEMYMMEKNDWYQYADPPVMYQAYETWPAQRDQLVRELLAGSVTGEELLAEMDAYWTQAFETEGDLLGIHEEEDE